MKLRGFFFIYLIAFLTLSCQSENKKDSNLPNILFLLADDLGYGELGVYGQKIIKTPFLDKLARNGMRFTDFHSGSSVYSPSRSVLMTGQHAGHVSIRGNTGIYPNEYWDSVALRKDEITLGEMLQEAGYQTAFIGKWHLANPNDASNCAGNHGFDYAVQEQWGANADGYNFDEKVHWINNMDDKIRYNQEAYACIDEFRTNFALKYLEEKDSDKPFFLFMSYHIPDAHEFYIRNNEMYEDNDWPDIERRHAAGITLLDTQINRLIKKLEESGELDNTLIFFTSDNGPRHEQGHDHNFFQSSKGLKGHKRDLYEGGIRVPLIAYWKNKIKAGASSKHIAAFYDFMPTLAEVAGIKIPEQSDGISLLPELLGKKQTKHKYLYWEIQLNGKGKNGYRQAARMGKWKAVRYGDNPVTELYNLEKDLGEEHNLAKEYPEVVMQLEQFIQEANTKTNHYPNRGLFKKDNSIGSN